MLLALTVITRARSQIGLHTVYCLGHGGLSPTSPTAADDSKQCDCTGFVPWCLGVSRRSDNPWYEQMNGGWMNADSIYRDCAVSVGMFDGIEWKDARPGDVLVFAAVPHGHVGIVTRVDEAGPTHVAHCSHGNYRATGDAIQETDVLIFKANGARVARAAWVEQ